jgi:hypothetical protein
MWSYVEGVANEIPDVLDSMGLEPQGLLAASKDFFEQRFAAAGLAITA